MTTFGAQAPPVTVADNIKRLRTDRGDTQAFVADLVSMHRSNYSKIESGQREPSVRALKTIADHYGVTLDDLVAGTAEAQPAPPAEPDTASADALQRARLLDSLPEQERTAAFTMIDALVSRNKLRAYIEEAVAA